MKSRAFAELEGSCSSAEFESAVQNSYEGLESFFLDLQKEIHLKSNSSLFKSYDFYHDCVVRHLGQNSIAFRIWEENSWKEWSYDHIHRLVNYQVNRWRNQQENWRGNVAIAIPLGIHFLVALLTVIRLGLTFTALPLDSPLLPPKRLRSILDQLGVEILFASPEASSTISGNERHWLIEYLEESTKYEPEKERGYKPKELFQLAYGCHLQNEHTLLPVSAEECYLSALRDSHLIFDLKPKMTLGYSPDCSLREQPHLILTAMLSGSTTVILPDKELRQNSQLASSQQIDVIGITPHLRDLWSEEGGFPKSKVTHWYCNLFYDDEKAWSIFSKKNSLEKLVSKRLFIDNAYGGVALASFKVADEETNHLWPSFGTKWELLQYGQQKAASVHHYGIFKQSSTANLPSNWFLTRQRVGWEVATTVTPQSRGYTIPVERLEKSVELLDFVDFAFFLTLPLPYHSLTTQSILLVFINPLLREELPKQEIAWKSEINGEIAKNLGTVFIPDKIEIFSLSPRVEEGILDRNWCSHQYTSGLLNRKQSLKIYHWISLLKKSALD